MQAGQGMGPGNRSGTGVGLRLGLGRGLAVGVGQAIRAQAQARAALSPRQQQAVRLLLLPSADYAQLLRQSACDNPFLEWAEESWDEAAHDGESESGREIEACESSEFPESPEFPEAGVVTRHDLSAELPQAPADPLAQLPSHVTLADHLAAQLRLLRLPARERYLALALVYCLDEDGYLRLPLQDLGDALTELQPPASSHELALALARVQALEPTGVGACDLAECLGLQLRGAQASAHPEALALAIVQDHLPALAAGDLAGLARRLGQPLARVQLACDRIRQLDPRPGWRFGPPGAGAITPDVVVRRRQGQWVAHLNPAALPRLRLQRAYADWYAGHRAQGDPAAPALGQCLQEARWTLRNIEQRRSTILAVARAILQRQHRFLALGPLGLRPLALREIAQAVGVHESTVSRATQQKYMATPCGLFELKFFFSRGLAIDGGGQCSPAAVRDLIRQRVAAEPPGAPLSDVDLARALAAQGLQVARRTVTKYRQQLRIEAAPQRGSAALASAVRNVPLSTTDHATDHGSDRSLR